MWWNAGRPDVVLGISTLWSKRQQEVNCLLGCGLARYETSKPAFWMTHFPHQDYILSTKGIPFNSAPLFGRHFLSKQHSSHYIGCSFWSCIDIGMSTDGVIFRSYIQSITWHNQRHEYWRRSGQSERDLKMRIERHGCFEGGNEKKGKTLSGIEKGQQLIPVLLSPLEFCSYFIFI